jgi:hypothetical protein
LVLAALTPTLALMEPWISWLMERFGLSRALLPVLCHRDLLDRRQGSAASFGGSAGWKPLAMIPRVAQLNFSASLISSAPTC